MNKLFDTDFVFVTGPQATTAEGYFDVLSKKHQGSAVVTGPGWALWRGAHTACTQTAETLNVASGFTAAGGIYISPEQLAPLTPASLSDFSSQWRGQLACLSFAMDSNKVSATTDHMRLQPVHYGMLKESFAVATDIRLLTGLPGFNRSINLDAISHYLDYEYVPPPHSIFKGIKKLEMGYEVRWDNNQIDLKKYWQPPYAEDLTGSEDELTELLTENIRSTIAKYLPTEPNNEWGTFLSGGTDSSTIAGVLSDTSESPINTFSIGFSEDEYDELTYARMASKRFGANGYEHILSADESLSALSDLMSVNDEPFGNSSALATIGCTKLANQHGVSIMLGGDGGDEIFGGNERYAKDQIYDTYHRLPSFLRNASKSVASALPGDSFFVNRLRNFTHRGNMKNPDRFFSGDSFASNEFDSLYSNDFRSEVSLDGSLEVIRRIYNQADTSSETHKMMFMDLYMAISGNDVVKVNRSAAAADVDYVKFPFLDVDLIEFMGRLPPKYKVYNRQKRYLFKKAVAKIVPSEILVKKKQGFGLPISLWMRDDKDFIEIVDDCLFSKRATDRGYFNADFLKTVVARHKAGAWDYAPEIWRFVVLELWHRNAEDAF